MLYPTAARDKKSAVFLWGIIPGFPYSGLSESASSSNSVYFGSIEILRTTQPSVLNTQDTALKRPTTLPKVKDGDRYRLLKLIAHSHGEPQ